MATNIKTLKDTNGDLILPKTSTHAVYDQGTGKLLDQAIEDLKLIPLKPYDDLNNLPDGRYYTPTQAIGDTILNKPTGIVNIFWLETYSNDTFSYKRQVLHSYYNLTYNRGRYYNEGVVWSNWIRSANGDGLIESGSNSNGSYAKFEDGTMICRMHERVLSLRVSVFATNDATQSYWTFPSAFISAPEVVSTLGQGNSKEALVANVTQADTTAVGMNVRAYHSTGSFNASSGVYAMAIAFGRWK